MSLPQSDRQIKPFTGVHTYIHKAHMHACTCTHTYLYAHAHTCTRINMHAHTNTCVHTYIYVPTHVHIYHSQEDTGRQSPAGLSFPGGHLTSTHPLVDPREVIPRGGAGSKDLEEKVSKMAPSTRRCGQAERRFGPSAAVTVPSGCQRAGSPPRGKEEPSQKDERSGGLASLLQLLPQRAHPLDPKRPPFSHRAP